MIDEVYLPNAIMLGVDYELFWQLSPSKLIPFVRAYEERKKDRLNEANFIAWISGVYVSHAVAAVLGEGSGYPERPITIFEDEKSRDERKQKDAQAFGAYAAMFNKTYGKGDEDDSDKQISNENTEYNTELQGKLQSQR